MYAVQLYPKKEIRKKTIIIDTAIRYAREYSKDENAMYLVMVDRTEHVRAFAVDGVVWWAVACKICGGDIEEREYCVRCNTIGFEKGDIVTP